MHWKTPMFVVLAGCSLSGNLQAQEGRSYGLNGQGSTIAIKPAAFPGGRWTVEQGAIYSLSCDEAYARAEDASHSLAAGADSLRRCAEDEILDKAACAREVRRVLSAQSEFKGAVAGVEAECD